MNDHSPLLTIAIPTYNRASDLDAALGYIARQVGPFSDIVEILVSDNCSTDNTPQVIKSHSAAGLRITYLRNNANIGPDNNFLQCFNKASGRYFWLVGDDDIILPDALENIIPLLKQDNFGVVFLASYGFKDDYLKEVPCKRREGNLVFKNPDDFLRIASYFLTFISANIVNKEVLSAGIDAESFRSTNLIQLSWTLPAVFKGLPNVVVRPYCVAARMFNSGGYKLTQVFAYNFNAAMSLVPKINAAQKRIINRRLLSKFFPANIVRARRNKLGLKSEPYFRNLVPLYWPYPYFWIFTVPAIVMPVCVADFVLDIATALRRRLR